MVKGYWIALVDVHDTEAYKGYMQENAVAFLKYGARFLIRGGAAQNVEGSVRSRRVVLEFKDYATALECYNSPEYAKAILLRKDVSTADILVIEGYDGPQPAEGQWLCIPLATGIPEINVGWRLKRLTALVGR